MPGAGVGRHPDLVGSAMAVYDEFDSVPKLDGEDVVGQLYFERFAQTQAQVVELSEQLRQRVGGLFAIGLFSEGLHRYSCRKPNQAGFVGGALGLRNAEFPRRFFDAVATFYGVLGLLRGHAEGRHTLRREALETRLAVIVGLARPSALACRYVATMGDALSVTLARKRVFRWRG